MEIGIEEARKLILTAQKLTGTANPVQANTLEVISSLGHVQIDTISIVQRAHHHIIWARNQNYTIGELDLLIAKRQIFEYWSHAASYLPITNYRFCLPRMHQHLTGKKHWFKVDAKVKKYVFDLIKNEGPKKARDFKSVKKNSGWFDWNPAKRALEQLFMEGTLMATRRDGFHKVYDLKENVLPRELDIRFPSEKEFAQFLIFDQLKNLGLAQADELAYQRGAQTKALVRKSLEELAEDKQLLKVTLKNHKLPYYLQSKSLNDLEAKNIGIKEVHILSPFDNLVIQRKRLEKLFDFNYQVECYVPEQKRKFGYFCLPLLVGDQFIGRMDVKAHRKTKHLEIRKIFYEDSVKNKDPKNILQEKLQAFCRFNDCQTVKWAERQLR